MRDFYCFEMQNLKKESVVVRQLVNGKCVSAKLYPNLPEERQKKLRKRLLYQNFYSNYGKVGKTRVSNVNGFEIYKENENFIIKYFSSGIKVAQSSYQGIDKEKEKRIVQLLINCCLNNMEAEKLCQSHTLIFIILEVDHIIFN